ncbi:MAG: MFS transporter [Candidatus Thermoplasmatota archaeon]
MSSRTPREKKLLVYLLGFMGFWVMGDNYAASPILVDIAAEFGVGIGTAAMTVTAYMLPFGLFTIAFGPLADRFGKVRVITTAALGTAIFSSLAAAAFNIYSLGALRAVNGVFAAAILPVTISLIGDVYEEPKSKMNSIGTVMGMYFLGAAAATAIGGGLSFIGSWRIVYLTYGIAELILVVLLYKFLTFEKGTVDKLSFREAYSDAVSHSELLKTVALLFLVGFAVFGSFTYLGEYLVEKTGYNLLAVGFILTLFGLAAFTGGRRVGTLKKKIGPKILFIAGVLGLISLLTVSYWLGIYFVLLALFGFGLSFVILQVTIITTAQQYLPEKRGTVMSLASFNMFIGGAVGIFINRTILASFDYQGLFMIAGFAIFIVGTLAFLMIGLFSKEGCSAIDCLVRLYRKFKVD